MTSAKKCPRTGVNLLPLKIGGAVVDISEACGGVFFDRFELQRFDDEHEIRGEVLAAEMETRQNSAIDFSQRIKCPNCPGIVMMRRWYSPLRAVEIDECPQCAGIWLDAGELTALRQLLPNAQERERVGQEYVAEIMDSEVMVAHERELENELDRADSLKRLLRRIIGF